MWANLLSFSWEPRLGVRCHPMRMGRGSGTSIGSMDD
jgi:hypothetical protein